jgi:hypothetical protein
MRASLVSLCFVLSSCVPFPYRTGPYATSLRTGDVAQIRALVRDRKDIRHPIDEIEMVAPDRAIVQSGLEYNPPGGTISQFTVRKRNGRWAIEESSIGDRNIIVWSEPVSSN